MQHVIAARRGAGPGLKLHPTWDDTCSMASFFWAFTLLATLEGPSQSARFAVDDLTRVAASAFATVEPRADAPGHSWIRIYFYAFELTPTERELAAVGDRSVLKNWEAILQLTVDESDTVSQMDLALPGHLCAIVQTQRDAALVTQTFQFDGKRLRFKSKAFSVCDLKQDEIPGQKFEWDVDLDTAVVARASTLR
jgi:hypothetical protein